MEYHLRLQELNDNEITLRVSPLIGALKVSSDELLVMHKANSVSYEIHMPVGTLKTLSVRRRLFGLDPLPIVQLGATEIHLDNPLKNYEYALCMVPLVLVSKGAIGGLLGLIGTRLNLNSVRINQKGPLFLRLLLVLLITTSCFLIDARLSKLIVLSIKSLRK